MFTEAKTRRAGEEGGQEGGRQEGFQEQLIGYNFLRNVWGTYFFGREEVASEDKLDRINKIVGMLKAQVKLMIAHEADLIHSQLPSTHPKEEAETTQFLQVELERTKESLERSRMREEELAAAVTARDQQLQSLRQHCSQLQAQLQEAKQAKNKCEERVIELSNQVYELQHAPDCRLDDSNNTLDQFSAITLDREPHRPRVSLFSKLDRTLNDEVHSEEEADEREGLVELNLNLNVPRNPLKHSLQIYDRAEADHSGFMEEMKKIKLRTERMMEAENSHRHVRRNTFAGPDSRPSLPAQQQQPQQHPETRRFRRIRC